MTDTGAREVDRRADPHGNVAHYIRRHEEPTYMGWNVALCGVECYDEPEQPRPDGEVRPLCATCEQRAAQQ